MSENGLRFILEDDGSFFWIGTWGSGVNRFDPRQRGLPVFERHLLEPSTFSHESANSVRAGAKHPSGTLWFGTWGGAGLFRYDPQTAVFNNYKPERNNPNSLSRGFIEDIFIDSNNMIWICDGVLTRFNPQVESFVHVKFHQS